MDRPKDMTHKWASASTSGRLTFDVDLLDEPVEKRNQVIVHELVHLKVGNHGPGFQEPGEGTPFHVGGGLMHHVGVLAYGSLLTSPGPELNEATAMRIEGVVTPFPVEFGLP